MTSQKQPKKSPGRGPKGKTGTTGAGLRLQKGRTASTEEWLATGGKKIADRCAPVVVVEDALNAMRIIYNRHIIIDPVVENLGPETRDINSKFDTSSSRRLFLLLPKLEKAGPRPAIN